MPLEDKFAEWKKEESSAAELFNSCLYVVLPIVKETVCRHGRDRFPRRYGRRDDYLLRPTIYIASVSMPSICTSGGDPLL
jgi:hypothetical protein